MRAKSILPAIITVILVSLSISIAVAQPPMPPCWFYGTVTIEGLPAQDNLNVTAGIRGTNITRTTKTKNGTYGWTKRGSSSFYIPSDDPETPHKDGGVNDDIIEFYINGVKTNQTTLFESLSLKRVDLAVGSATEANGDNEPTPNPNLPYVTLAVAIGILFVTGLWIWRKGYRVRVHNKA